MSATEIIPNLWLGNSIIAKNKNFFETNHIVVSINCTKDTIENERSKKMLKLSVSDSLEKEDIIKMYNLLDKTCDYIYKHLKTYNGIIVFCYAGKQRSATVIAAYLIKYGKMSLIEAIQTIRTKRQIAFTPGINFQEALVKFEKDQKI